MVVRAFSVRHGQLIRKKPYVQAIALAKDPSFEQEYLKFEHHCVESQLFTIVNVETFPFIPKSAKIRLSSFVTTKLAK